MDCKPITKEMAAALLSVSKSTIDNMVADGTLPRPRAIGRRVYWHPKAFYDWLDTRLGTTSLGHAQEAPPRKRGRPRKTPAI
jgi:excisionase family DNA binding protein